MTTIVSVLQHFNDHLARIQKIFTGGGIRGISMFASVRGRSKADFWYFYYLVCKYKKIEFPGEGGFRPHPPDPSRSAHGHFYFLLLQSVSKNVGGK